MVDDGQPAVRKGEAGVAHLINLLESEIEITLNLMGLSSIEQLRRAGTEVLR